MLATTFDQLFSLRSNCPCGSPLFTIVSRGANIDDDYTFVNCVGTHHWNDYGEEGIAFLINLSSNAFPYGQAEFLIKCPMDKPNFELLAAYEKESHRNGMTAEQFVKRHFTFGLQFKQKIHVKRECANRGNCKCNYTLVSDNITFDMDTQQLNQMKFGAEDFSLVDDNDRRIYFQTDFESGITNIKYINHSARFTIGKQESFELETEKFLRYPLDREFLLNKVKTFLLFS